MGFRAKNSVICEQITPLKANQIASITSDFKMDLIKHVTDLRSDLNITVIIIIITKKQIF